MSNDNWAPTINTFENGTLNQVKFPKDTGQVVIIDHIHPYGEGGPHVVTKVDGNGNINVGWNWSNK